MKKLSLIVVMVLAVFSTGLFAYVRVAGHDLSSEGYYLADRGLGVGILIGDTNALVLKSWLNKEDAMQYDLGFNVYGGYIGFGAAYLIHNFDIIQVENNKVPLYFGIKGYAALSGGSLYAGIEVPLGFDWIFKKAPVDIFVELDPGLQVISPNGMGPAYGGGVGVRYWFK
jgi:hypothetical protein